MIVILTVTTLFLLIGLALGLLFKKMAPVTASGQIINADDYSAGRYRPMQRLLDETDEQFLSSHPAFDKKMARKVRAERRTIFRGYLRCISRDYGRICSSIRTLMVQSDVDRPDLAKALARSEMLFVAGLFAVECRLFLHTVGWGTVDVRHLVASLEGMRIQLQSMASFQAAAA
jgi:hypothetical protein